MSQFNFKLIPGVSIKLSYSNGEWSTEWEKDYWFTLAQAVAPGGFATWLYSTAVTSLAGAYNMSVTPSEMFEIATEATTTQNSAIMALIGTNYTFEGQRVEILNITAA